MHGTVAYRQHCQYSGPAAIANSTIFFTSHFEYRYRLINLVG